LRERREVRTKNRGGLERWKNKEQETL
jgi:hypothetical protein